MNTREDEVRYEGIARIIGLMGTSRENVILRKDCGKVFLKINEGEYIHIKTSEVGRIQELHNVEWEDV